MTRFQLCPHGYDCFRVLWQIAGYSNKVRLLEGPEHGVEHNILFVCVNEDREETKSKLLIMGI